MARTLEQLERQDATLHGIGGIVRTMKTLSAINALPYERAARAIDAYLDTVLSGLQAFLYRHGPLVQKSDRKTFPVLVALGSDHGLCGNYNELVAAEVVRQPRVARARLLTVGVRMESALAGRGLTPEAALLPPASADGLGRLAGELVTRLDAIARARGVGEPSVTLVYTRRGEHGRQGPVSERLLPLDPALIERLSTAPWSSRSLPRVALPAAELLAALLRDFLFASVFRAAAEALVTENAARLARMQQAARSVDERLETLGQEMRAVRQSEITTELLDVVVGFEALRARSDRSSAHSAPSSPASRGADVRPPVARDA